MNMLDMHTREQVNKIHLAELQRNARQHYRLSDLSLARTSMPVVLGARIRLVLIRVRLALLVRFFLITAIPFLILPSLGKG